MFRKLAAWMLHVVHPAAARTIIVENAPINVEVVYNSRGQDSFVHLLNFSGDRRVGNQRIQDFIPAHGIQVRIRCAARPKRVLLVPEKKTIAFEWKDGWAGFQAQPLLVHGAYMIEG